MQVQNNKEEVPFAHYEEKFRALDPIESAKRCGVPFADGKFSVRLLGVTYQITWPDYAITADRDGAFGLSSLPCQTFLLRFLLEGRQAAPSSQFKTFREMPWGEMYIQPYTGRVLTRAAFTFGTKVAKFAAACEKMGAIRLPHGDAGYQFDFLGGYRMQIMVYAGDERAAAERERLVFGGAAGELHAVGVARVVEHQFVASLGGAVGDDLDAGMLLLELHQARVQLFFGNFHVFQRAFQAAILKFHSFSLITVLS